MASFRRSFTDGSEEVLDTLCDICSKDDRTVDATSFCSDCPGNLCTDCSKWHDKFPATKGHTVRNLAGVKGHADGGVDRQQSQGMTKPIQDAIPPLPRRAGSQPSKPTPPPRPDYQELRFFQSLPANLKPNEAFDLQEKLEQLKRSKYEQLKQVDTEEGTNLNSVQQLRNTLVKRVEDLSVTELENITKVHEAERQALRDEIKQIDEHIYKIGTDKTERGLHVGRDWIRRLSVENRRQPYVINTEIEMYLNRVESLGKFTSSDQSRTQDDAYLAQRAPRSPSAIISRSGANTGSSPKLLHEYNIAVRDEKLKCKAYGTCLLADGTVVLTDNENKRLKLLNRQTSVCVHYDLPCGPWGVCSTNLYEVAVTLTNEKRVQFVSVGKSIGLTSSFSVDQYCRGIAHHQGNLYVTCGSLNQPGSGYVGVFTLTGQSLHRIQNGPDDVEPLFSVPHHVMVCDNGRRICVADKTKGVVVVERNGIVFKSSKEDIGKAFGICALDNGDIIACGLNSDTIVQFSMDGRKKKTLLDIADGLYGPYSVLVDQANSALIVTTYESSYVKVYTLK